MYTLLLIAMATGFLTKFVDLAEEHGLRTAPLLSRLAGLTYGFLIAYVISASADLSALWLATVIGVIVRGKIDTPGHSLGIGAMLFCFPIFGLAEINLVHLVLFILVSSAEEIVNDNLVDKGKIHSPKIRRVLECRPLLEVAALAVSIVTSRWLIWFGLLSFDIGYNVCRLILSPRTPSPQARNLAGPTEPRTTIRWINKTGPAP